MQDTLILLFTTLTWFGLSMVIFLTLSQFFPANKGYPAWRHDSFTDMIYWFFGSVVYGKITAIGVSAILAYLYAGDAAKILMFEQKGHPFWSDWPLLAQALIILLVTDVMMYWIHRIFHRTPFIWKFHAIHHSSRQVDWLSTSRFHPLNYVVYITLPLIITIIIGFSPDAFALLLPFNILFSAFVHSNLPWTLGPFKYVLASPVFHRWHHTYVDEGGDKNFSPTFPFLDILFGTFYMPEGKLPEKFGVEEEIPSSFVGQLLYPFKK